jgi:hypothetical protein
MDLATIDVLARLELAGRRLGFELRLYPSPDLLELIDFVGLREVLGQAEEREEPLRVEEEGQLGDAAG